MPRQTNSKFKVGDLITYTDKVKDDWTSIYFSWKEEWNIAIVLEIKSTYSMKAYFPIVKISYMVPQNHFRLLKSNDQKKI